jgi:hypothetical protein
MTDISRVIEPKSDQLNADDLLTGAISATITGVDVRNTREQPISVHLDCFPRPWKPCKSMARIMAAVWGKDSSRWIGQGVTLYNDPEVKWAGVAVGGIRISHMTGIAHDKPFNLTVSKGKRKQTIIKPMQAALVAAQPQNSQQTGQSQPQQPKAPQEPAQAEIAHFGQQIMATQSMDQLVALWGQIPPAVKPHVSALKDQAKAALEKPPEQPAANGIESF